MLKKCVQGNIFSRGITVCCWVDSFGAIPVFSMIILLIWQHFQRKTENSQTDVWIANVWSIINTKWSNLSNEFIIPHLRSFFVAVVQDFLPPPHVCKVLPSASPFSAKKRKPSSIDFLLLWDQNSSVRLYSSCCELYRETSRMHAVA